MVGPGFTWGKGYAVDGVSITDNKFENVSGPATYISNNDDISHTSPAYDLNPTMADLSSLNPTVNIRKDNRNILIQGNSLSNLGQYGWGIQGVPIIVRNASNVRICGNSFPKEPGSRALPHVVVAPATTENVRIE